MKVNGIEIDFLVEVRKASPEDCRRIIEVLHGLEGLEDERGNTTTLGYLAGAVEEELQVNGVMKAKFGPEAYRKLSGERKKTK